VNVALPRTVASESSALAERLQNSILRLLSFTTTASQRENRYDIRPYSPKHSHAPAIPFGYARNRQRVGEHAGLPLPRSRGRACRLPILLSPCGRQAQANHGNWGKARPPVLLTHPPPPASTAVPTTMAKPEIGQPHQHDRFPGLSTTGRRRQPCAVGIAANNPASPSLEHRIRRWRSLWGSLLRWSCLFGAAELYRSCETCWDDADT
jgi:hypothetical protein